VDKNRKSPKPDWMTFVKTGTARTHIKSQTKNRLTNWIKETEESSPDAKRQESKRHKGT